MTESAEFTVSAEQRQLFIDDHGVDTIENLTRTLHQPSKKGAVIRPPLGEKAMQTRSTPHWNEELGRFRVLAVGKWYESPDGLHWTRDDTPTLKEERTPWGHVLYEPSDPDPQRRYKGLAMHVVNEETGLEVKDSSEMVDPEGKPWPEKKFKRFLDFMVSGDGVNWSQLDCSLSSSDEQNMSYDPLGKQYIVSLKRGGTYGRSHAITTSSDFESWSDPVLAIQADDLDQELGRLHIEEYLKTSNADYLKPFPNTPAWHWQNVDIYNVGVFRYEGIFLALPAIYHAKGARWTSHCLRFTHIQLWSSRALNNWERVANRQAFIPWSPGGSGAYDLNKNMPPSCPLVRGDELWFYYSGRKEYSIYPVPDLDGAAVCLAVLRRDGFVSLDADSEEGRVTTEPFNVPTDKLWLNANAAKGQLRVEVVNIGTDETVAVSVPIEEDARRVEVQWQDGNFSAHTGKPVRLRFTLRNAELYSYWFD